MPAPPAAEAVPAPPAGPVPAATPDADDRAAGEWTERKRPGGGGHGSRERLGGEGHSVGSSAPLGVQTPHPASAVSAAAPTEPPATEGLPASAEPAPAPGGATYEVRSGDTLWSIASRLAGGGASPAEIARLVDRLWQLNADRVGTGSPDLIFAGTILSLPERG